MQRMKMVMVVSTLVFIWAACAGNQSARMAPGESGIKTVSVAAFKCSDPLIAQEIQNKIIESWKSLLAREVVPK